MSAAELGVLVAEGRVSEALERGLGEISGEHDAVRLEAFVRWAVSSADADAASLLAGTYWMLAGAAAAARKALVGAPARSEAEILAALAELEADEDRSAECVLEGFGPPGAAMLAPGISRHLDMELETGAGDWTFHLAAGVMALRSTREGSG